MRSALIRCVSATAVVLVAACGSVGPPPVVYVLGAPPVRDSGAVSLLGRPVLEVKPVLMPDYLDVSEILTRRPNNVMQPSAEGRWAERLSVGTTRALAAELRRRLPDVTVTTSTPAEAPICRLFVDVESFERATDAPVTLTAQWRITDGAAQKTLAGERVAVSAPVAETGDAATVEAMGRAVDQLADRIAAGARGIAPACGTRGA